MVDQSDTLLDETEPYYAVPVQEKGETLFQVMTTIAETIPSEYAGPMTEGEARLLVGGMRRAHEWALRLGQVHQKYLEEARQRVGL